jgi:predicted DNA-binding protein (MmcQ/YjbR family)
MGCGPQAKTPSLQRADTLIGILKVTVLDAQFPK